MKRKAAIWIALAISVASCGATRRPAPDDLHAMPVLALSGNVTWTGTMLIDRIVIIRKGAHLRILPGTVIRFRRVDWDGDGIGDAEITVEGRLTAEGTPEAPIVFASAEPTPRPSDWKYLMINFAAGASVTHARISHAFSGIQVHFSPAQVSACEFVHNVDGVRFSTARLRVEGCWIHGNTNGVRFEERGQPAQIVGNEISENEVGIFAVAECLGRSVFEGNNFRGNRYAVKFGLDQRWPLAFSGNYWGEVSEADLLAGIIDQRVDSRLGRVTLGETLSAPAPVSVPPFRLPPGAILQ